MVLFERNCRAFFCALLALSSVCAQGGAGPQNAPVNGNSDSGGPSVAKVPPGVILVKGAWSSASDSVTPLPEDGNVTKNVFEDPYFGVTWALPPDWIEKYKGPPPSDSGRYVLAQIVPSDNFKGPARGSILITADDQFFSPLSAGNSLEYANYLKDHLQADYQVERVPAEVEIGGRTFTSFVYWSPVAQLHWYVFGTQIRCHTFEVVLSSRDTKLLEELTHALNKMILPAEQSADSGAVPVCIQDYARGENLIARVDPVVTERRFNTVPVRVIIDKQGQIRHIHFLSAFPDQAKAITDALHQWKFRPYMRNGQPAEVETGILFGRVPPPAALTARDHASK